MEFEVRPNLLVVEMKKTSNPSASSATDVESGRSATSFATALAFLWSARLARDTRPPSAFLSGSREWRSCAIPVGGPPSSASALPIVGAAFQVSNGDNDDLGWRETVDNLVWKTRDQHAAGLGIAATGRTNLGAGLDQRQHLRDGIEELPAEARTLVSYQRTASINSSDAGSPVRTMRFTGRGDLSRSGASRLPKVPA